jgi:hypothetical protein
VPLPSLSPSHASSKRPQKMSRQLDVVIHDLSDVLNPATCIVALAVDVAYTLATQG